MARDGQVKPLAEAGIDDIAAALALTVNGLVWPHKPKVTTEPD